MEYRCRKCEYRFCSENGIPYCPACDCESLKEIIETKNKSREMIESHHIHPKFMSNKKGDGEQFMISKNKHDILHGKIMNWIWEEIGEEDKKRIIQIIINKSKNFIGIK